MRAQGSGRLAGRDDGCGPGLVAAVKKTQRKTRAQLERQVKDLNAQLASTYHFAAQELRGMVKRDYRASAVVVEVTALGGASLLSPVAIRDGLSKETIEALIADVMRSYASAVEFKP